jgi:hypothetical protein
VGYIGHPVDNNMTCKLHPDGCGKYIKVGGLGFVDASEATFHRGHYFVSIRALNSLGERTCKVGLLNVLCDQMHVFGNRIGVFTKIEGRAAGYNDRMVEVTTSGKNLITAQPLNPLKGKHSLKKKGKNHSSSDSDEAEKQNPKKTCNQTVGAFNQQLDACLNRNPSTINLHDTVLDVAWLRLLDGGYPGSHPVVQADDSDLPNRPYTDVTDVEDKETIVLEDSDECGEKEKKDSIENCKSPAEAAKERSAAKQKKRRFEEAQKTTTGRKKGKTTKK